MLLKEVRRTNKDQVIKTRKDGVPLEKYDLISEMLKVKSRFSHIKKPFKKGFTISGILSKQELARLQKAKARAAERALKDKAKAAERAKKDKMRIAERALKDKAKASKASKKAAPKKAAAAPQPTSE
tara:strand:- start:1858 stop:2238 length:381 start_codon:yes stop_codon:yes gene_type:complete